eukprot:2605916-Pyramimonas_sp.AAC.1
MPAQSMRGRRASCWSRLAHSTAAPLGEKNHLCASVTQCVTPALSKSRRSSSTCPSACAPSTNTGTSLCCAHAARAISATGINTPGHDATWSTHTSTFLPAPPISFTTSPTLFATESSGNASTTTTLCAYLRASSRIM